MIKYPQKTKNMLNKLLHFNYRANGFTSSLVYTFIPSSRAALSLQYVLSAGGYTALFFTSMV
jgi:hypothetical protein